MKKILLCLGVVMSVVFAKSVLPKSESIMLDNGLMVVVIPIHNESNVIETNVFYKVGSRNEVMGKSGIAHILEHLSFKSTKNLEAGEFDEIVKGFGGVNNASTSFDYTRYFIRSSAQNVDKSLELFAELMSNLNLKEQEFASERQVVAEERRWRTDNSPAGYLYFKFFNTAFTYHPYHWTPIGFMEDILHWKLEDIQDFYTRFYQPSNAIILVAGDIEPKEVFESAKRHFASIANTRPLQDAWQKEPPQDGYREIIIKKDTQIQWLMMGYKIPNFEHKDQVALSALADILSDGQSSIFEVELVHNQQIASEVSAYPMALRDDGVFVITAVGNKDIQAQTMQKEIIKILDRIKKEGITQEDLDKVKLNMKAKFVSIFERSSSVASLFGSFLVRGNLNPLLEYEERFAKLSAKDIQEVAKKYFNQDTLSVGILKK